MCLYGRWVEPDLVLVHTCSFSSLLHLSHFFSLPGKKKYIGDPLVILRISRLHYITVHMERQAGFSHLADNICMCVGRSQVETRDENV